MALNRRRAVTTVATVVVGLSRGGSRVGSLTFDLRYLGKTGSAGFEVTPAPAARGTAAYVQRPRGADPEYWGFDFGKPGVFELCGLIRLQSRGAGEGRFYLTRAEWDDATLAGKARGYQTVTWKIEKASVVFC